MASINPRKLRINHPPLPKGQVATEKYIADQQRQIDNLVLQLNALISEGGSGNFTGTIWTNPVHAETYIRMDADGGITIFSDKRVTVQGPNGGAVY